MKDITIKEIVEITNAQLIQGDKNCICKTFSKDTRTIQKGDIYIGIKGEKFDGNQFWKQALENGAIGVIVQDVEVNEQALKKYKDKVILKVEDTLQALYKIASYKRNLYNVPVIAITGSVGKTSTKDIVANVVSQKFKTLKTIGNNNNNIGLPFTILNAPEDIDAMVLEMGMNHFGEIHLLSKIAKPNICIITNIGTSHIGNLGSRENILKAKLEILDGAQNPQILINNDNDLLHKWYDENKNERSITTYGIYNKSDIMAENCEQKQESSIFTVCIEGQDETIEVPVGGEHFILNSLCAIAVGKILKISKEDIKKGIETFKLTKNRMETINLENGVKIINDAYNSSVESIEATIKYMNTMNVNRKIAVLGDVLETGNFAKDLHRKIGEIVFENHIDILICNGENAKYIIQSAKEKGFNKENLYYLGNKEKIMELLHKIVKPEDVILFKASNGMKFFEMAEKLKKEGCI